MLLCINFLIIFSASAQDKFPQLRTKLDRVFARIDKSQIPSGILEENSFGFMNLWQVNTIANLPTDSTHAINSTVWRSTYATLETGKINNNYNLPTLQTVNQRIKDYRLANPTHNPIMLLRANYSCLDSNAVRDGLFTVQNGQLRDVVGRNRSPYLQRTVYMAASDIQDDNDGEVTFVLPRNLAIDNDTITPPIWFGHLNAESEGNTVYVGSAYARSIGRNMFGYPFTFRYTTPGIKEVKLSFRRDFQTTFVLTFHIRITKTKFGTTAGGRNEVDSTNTATTQRYENQQLREFDIPSVYDVHKGVKLQIRLSQNNNLVQPANDVRLRKPLIVLEGYDGSFYNNPIFTAQENYDIFRFLGNRGIEQANGLLAGFNLNNELDMASYDLIFVDYAQGADDIGRNAQMFRDVLRWVNARKEEITPGVREQNVVLGLSMGGLVGRYGLAQMEKARRAGEPNNVHEVRMLITHDSPHRGANVPIALQSLVETGRPLIWAMYILPYLQEIALFLDNEANKQMAIYKTVPIGPLLGGNILYQKNTWLDETYRPMVTFPAATPAPYQFIALSNGSECGTRHAAPYTPLMKNKYTGFLQPIPWLIKSKLTTEINMRALPDRQVRSIYDLDVYYTLSLFGGFINIDVNLVNVNGKSHADMLPIDGMAGGTQSAGLIKTGGYDTPDWLSWLVGFERRTTAVENYTFVPKYSALDIRPDVSVEEIIANRFTATQTPSRSTANRIFTAPTTNGGVGGTAGSEFNQRHLLFTNRNANFIFSQMEPTNANGTLPILDCFSAICNTNTSTINSTLPSLCFGVPNIFSVSNLPTPAIVTWTASNNLVQLNFQGQPNTAIITPRLATSRGWVTITADISAPECNAFTRTVTRRIWVGAANTLTMTSVVQGCNLIITANSPGATNFEWSLDNTGVSFGIANTPNSIAINAAEWISLNLSQIKVTCKAGNSCNATPLEREDTYDRPSFPLCPLRVMPKAKLNMFPNPTSAILNLEFENLPAKVSSICVQNMLGIKVLCTENIQLSADNKTNLDLSKLPEGIYILQVVYENGTTSSQKVVVQQGVIAN